VSPDKTSVKQFRRPLSRRRPVDVLVTILAVVAILASIAAIALLYDIARQEERARLLDIALTQARFIEATYRQADGPDPFAETVRVIRDAGANFEGYGRTGELVVAAATTDSLEFLFGLRDPEFRALTALPNASRLAEPMRRALAGNAGTMIGKDYRGRKVFAGYAPAAGLRPPVGVVAKIDLAEVRAPFLRAAAVAVLVAALLIVVGRFYIRRVGDALVTRLAKTRALQHAFLEANPDAFLRFDRHGTHLEYRPSASRRGKVDPAVIIGTNVRDFLPPTEAEHVLAAIEHALDTGQVQTMEYRDGTTTRADVKELRLVPIESEEVIGVERDITERRRAEAALRQLSGVVKQNPSSIMITDTDGVIGFVNQAFTELTGYSAEDTIDRTPNILKSGLMPDSLYEELWAAVKNDHVWHGELLNRKKDGTTYWARLAVAPLHGSDGEITNLVGIHEDITLQRQYEEQLLHQANYDTLTDLPNRFCLLDRLAQILASPLGAERRVAVLFVGLDNLSRINDTLGHNAGDALLVEAGVRLLACTGKDDIVGRFGGDRFVVVLPDCGDDDAVDGAAGRIQAVLAEPIRIGERELYITASVGVAVAPVDGDAPERLFRNADATLVRAKADGHGLYRRFTRGMEERAARHLLLESHLRGAVDRGELSVHYQPIVDITSGAWIGAEALLRWESSELGPVSPGEFIPVAEETGLIEEIGRWVLETSCREASDWRTPDDVPIRLFVNVSAHQFRDGAIVPVVAGVLESSGLCSSCLALEVTERVLLSDDPTVAATFESLIGLGVTMSIDDFGTGYSSLGYLRRYPFRELKIDREYVRDLASHESAYSMVAAVIGMAHGLGLHVVGEGVETEEQLGILRDMACDLVQGFYFARPVAPEEFAALLDEQNHRCRLVAPRSRE